MDSIQTLRNALEDMERSTHFAQYRLDTVQRELEMENFTLDSIPLKIKKTGRTHYTKKLLSILELSDKQLTCGKFLEALNKYLIQNNYVNLNNLQIEMSPLIFMTFHIPLEEQRVPYARLLSSLKYVFD